LHIVYKISIGGGPDAYIRNISTISKQHKIDLTIILDTEPNGEVRTFPKNISIYYLERGSTIPYYIYRISTFLRLPIHFSSKLIRMEEENRLLKTLYKIEKNKLIDIVEVTEGAFINQIAKRWKVIVRAHGSDWSFRMNCDDQNLLIDNYLKKWQRIQHLKASANFAISKHTRDHLSKELKLDKGLIRYMPYPICLENFSLAKPKSYKDIPSTSPIIMSVGRLERRKGTDIIVKSMNIVWEKYPNAYLILIGIASEFTIHDLKELVPKSHQKQIFHPGFINYKDIPSFYKAADIYVSASQYETFGYTLLEAIAADKPIICTDRGAMPELVVDGFNGLIVPFGDPKSLGESIIELLSNDELLKIFSKNSGEVVQKYDLSNYGDMLMQSYTEIINLPIN